METYLLTVSEIDRDAVGVRLIPGVTVKSLESRPGARKMIQGCAMELRKPDGSRSQTRLLTYGISVEKDQEGNIIYRGDIHNPEINITLPAEVSQSDLIPGTEVWLIDEFGEA